MFSSKLAELFISFVTRGQENVKATMNGISKQLDEVQAVGQSAGKGIDKEFAGLTATGQKVGGMLTGAQQNITAAMAHVSTQLTKVQGVGQTAGNAIAKALGPIAAVGQQIGGLFGGVIGAAFTKIANIGQTAFKLLTASVIGFTTAGIALSGMGTLLAYRLERLSLVMAGLFRPEIQKVIEYLTRFTNWLASSDNFIRKFLDALAPIERAFVRIVDIIMAQLSPAFERLMSDIAELTNDITSLLGFAIENVLIPQLEALVFWATELVHELADAMKLLKMMSGLQPWSDLTKQPSPSRAPFAPKAGGAEQLGAAYNRISQLSLMATGGKSVEEQQLDTLKQIEKNTGKGTQVARPGTPSYSEGSSGWGDVAAGVVKAMIPLPVMP